MISAFICDLDGLISDTEGLHLKAYLETFSSLGIELTTEQYQDHWIRKGLGVAQYVESNNLPFNPTELHSQKAVRYKRIVSESAEPMPGAVEFLMRTHGVKKLALASNSYRDDIEAVLKRIGVIKYFGAILSRDDVSRIKPFPDIFLHAARQIDADPSECVVLEDAQKGIEAAINAGMKCIAIPNQYTQDNDFSQATTVVKSLNDVTLDLIDSL